MLPLTFSLDLAGGAGPAVVVRPAAYAARRRRGLAASLLGGGAAISEVAHGCGFADQSHLTRQFRRETGLTPAVFRRLAAADVAFVQDGGARVR